MEFIKKHYEKILLGLVLLGLTVAVALLPLLITGKRHELELLREALRNPKIKPLTNLDLTIHEASLQRVSLPANLDFSWPHYLFNPVPWQKQADGKLSRIPAETEKGPSKMEVSSIKPLYLILTLEGVGAGGYLIGIKRDAAADASHRQKTQTYASVTNTPKTAPFTLLKVDGPADNPTDLVVELKDSSQQVAISTNRPFQRVDGFTADLKYDPEKLKWADRRQGDWLSFAGDDYKIVVITQSNVVLSAKANDKKTTIKFISPTEPR
ncbi:MAG TPA: hypothetical protein VH598_06260 [Verrucomicrobiae bacterium]|jgi:hypothetical protein|nr:hypothetical protein [Verrucomicrobiae bacterium]